MKFQILRVDDRALAGADPVVVRPGAGAVEAVGVEQLRGHLGPVPRWFPCPPGGDDGDHADVDERMALGIDEPPAAGRSSSRGKSQWPRVSRS